MDGRDLILLCVVVFIPGPDKHLMSQAGGI